MGVEMTELEKIDILRERGNIGYAAAKDLLDAADGDIVAALINLEAMQKNRGLSSDHLEERGREILEKIKELIRRGNSERIRVRKGDEVIMDIPITVGAVGVVLAPIATFLAGAACLLSRCTIEIRQRDGETITVHEGREEE